MQAIDSSGIRKVFDLAARIENPINLSIGQPDFDVPAEIKEVAIAAIEEGFNHYTVTQGIPELHDAFRSYYSKRYDVDLDATVVTSGVSGGLLLSFMALFDPGDEVMIADPYFVIYKHLVGLLGAVPRFINTYPDFRIRREALEAAYSPKTKAILVNSPANPTGAVLTEAELRLISDFAAEHNVLIISDEIYDQFTYDDPARSMAQFSDHVLVLNGLSKSAGMTGWRVGFAAGPEELIHQMTVLQQYSFVCAPSFAQRAAVRALDHDLGTVRDAYRQKRDLVYDGLSRAFELERPGGAFYAFPKAPGGMATPFVEKAIQHEVLIIPGSVFSESDTHFRVSFAAEDETLRRGVDILCELV
jgi:aspartate aminotransferase/aminotransferase